MRLSTLGALAILLAACGETADLSGGAAVAKKERNSGKTDEPAAPSNDPPAGPVGPSAAAIERTFSTLAIADDSIGYDPRSKFAEESVVLKRNYVSGAQEIGQDDRPTVIKTFRQGSPGASKVETFAQNSMGLLDLVVVVDNSGSMSQEQQNLSTKLDPLLTYIRDTDWQINVVTTDPANGCSRALIKRGDTNAATAFAAAVNAGLKGSGNEQGIRQAVAALGCTAPAWVRPKSSLAVLILSDEDNCSNGKGCAAPYNHQNHLLNYMSGTLGRPLGTQARVYGLIWVPGTSCKVALTAGAQYAAAVTSTNGLSGSICDADYSTTLRAISQNAASILKAQFELANVPDAGSLVIKVNNVVQATSAYTLVGRTVTFTSPPPVAATIRAEYAIGATPVLTRFPLGQVPANGTLTVNVNGAVAASGTYSVNASNELVFNSAPVANADIRASFRQNLVLSNRFPLAVTLRAGSLQVKVNGAAASNFTHTDGEIVFTSAPPDAAVIDVRYVEDRGPILTYDLAIGASGKLVSVVDATTGDAVDGTLNGQSLVVDAAAFATDRPLVVRYRDERTAAGSVALAHPPIAGSLTLAGGDCELGELDAGMVLAISCGDADAGAATVSYQYAVKRFDSFDMSEVTTPDEGSWSVFFDDEIVPDVTRAGTTIVLPARLSGPLATDNAPHAVRIVYEPVKQ